MDNCIFCKIVRSEMPATLLYEDSEIIAFRDIYPAAPTHIQVIPRQHIQSADDADETNAALFGKLIVVAAKIAKEQGFAGDGYRLITNVGTNGGQHVPHVHIHILAGRRLSWPPG